MIQGGTIRILEDGQLSYTSLGRPRFVLRTTMEWFDVVRSSSSTPRREFVNAAPGHVYSVTYSLSIIRPDPAFPDTAVRPRFTWNDGRNEDYSGQGLSVGTQASVSATVCLFVEKPPVTWRFIIEGEPGSAKFSAWIQFAILR